MSSFTPITHSRNHAITQSTPGDSARLLAARDARQRRRSARRRLRARPIDWRAARDRAAARTRDVRRGADRERRDCVAHLLDGGTTPWSAWGSGATAEQSSRFLPGAQQLELLRRLNEHRLPSPELARRVHADPELERLADTRRLDAGPDATPEGRVQQDDVDGGLQDVGGELQLQSSVDSEQSARDAVDAAREELERSWEEAGRVVSGPVEGYGGESASAQAPDRA